MKNTATKVLALTLASAFALSAPALANEGQQRATYNFIARLEAENLKYSYGELDEDGVEDVTVSYNDDFYDDDRIRFRIFFEEDPDTVSIRAWNLLNDVDERNGLVVVNELNSLYKYVKFVYDDSDNSVQCEIDCHIPKLDSDADMAFDAMSDMLDILTDEDCLDLMAHLKQ